MPEKPEQQGINNNPERYAEVLDTIPEAEPSPPGETAGEFIFQIFCAVIFLGMIGLVFYNAMLRYIFSSSYPPSEEWARFLFIYITFFGAIEAFYRRKHIAVDMFVDMFKGASRKAIEIFAGLVGIAVMAILLWGGVQYVLDTLGQDSVSTGVPMVFVYGTLPIMAFCSLLILIRDFIVLLKMPASEFKKG